MKLECHIITFQNVNWNWLFKNKLWSSYVKSHVPSVYFLIYLFSEILWSMCPFHLPQVTLKQQWSQLGLDGSVWWRINLPTVFWVKEKERTNWWLDLTLLFMFVLCYPEIQQIVSSQEILRVDPSKLIDLSSLTSLIIERDLVRYWEIIQSLCLPFAGIHNGWLPQAVLNLGKNCIHSHPPFHMCLLGKKA